MRKLLEPLVWLGIATSVACSGGQGGDPGQATGGGGAGGATGGQGGGGSGGALGGQGGGGSGGSPPVCASTTGIGVVSATLDVARPVLSETMALPELRENPVALTFIQRSPKGLITIGSGGSWEVVLGASPSKQRVGTDYVDGFAFTDLDGDGDPDLIGLRTLAGERRAFLWERDGDQLIAHGSFLATVYREREGYAREATGMAVGDVDADGDLDLAFVGPSEPRIMRNDGAFALTPIEGSADLGACKGCRVFGALLDDRDNDGILDLVALLDHQSLGENGTWVSLQRGDGHGVFGEASLTKVSEESDLGTVSYFDGDLDGNQLLDFVVTGFRSWTEGYLTHVVMSAADGSFQPATRTPYTIDDLVDADGDGSLDLVTVEQGALVLRASPLDNPLEPRRFELGLREGQRVVIEPGAMGSAPKVHTLSLHPCLPSCAEQCGACVFDACQACLNHDDCESGICADSLCVAASDVDAGSE